MSETTHALHFDDNIVGGGVQFVGLITKSGRLVAGETKNNFNLSKEQMEMFLITCSLHQRMQQDYDENFGQVQFSVIERENFRIIMIPQGQDTLMFVMDRNSQFSSGVQGLLDAIKYPQELV
jgi:hypothetical protein